MKLAARRAEDAERPNGIPTGTVGPRKIAHISPETYQWASLPVNSFQGNLFDGRFPPR